MTTDRNTGLPDRRRVPIEPGYDGPPAPLPNTPTPQNAPAFWAKITGCTAADSPAQNRWKYAWSEVEKTSAGYGGWTVKSGGRSGTTSTDPARNTIEDINTGADAHTEGNGVDPANLDTASYTFTMMPCTTNNPVVMHEVGFAVGSTAYTEYWFSYENGVCGSCD